MEDVKDQRENNADYTPGGVTGKGFKPGVSGNPGGRPKGRSITAEIRRLFEEGMDGHDIVKAMAKTGVSHALKGDFRYWKELVDRTDGKIAEDTDELARRIAANIRNRPPLATPPPPGAIQAGDGPAAVQAGPGGQADGQDDDEQTQAP